MRSSKKIGREATEAMEKTIAGIKTPLPDMKDDGAELKAAVAPKKAQTFSEAFREARAKAVKEGRDPSKEIFTWGGEKKVARLAGEGAKRPVATSAPARRSNTTTTTDKAATPTPKAEDKPKVNIDNRFISRNGNAPLRANAGDKPTPRPTTKPQSQRYNARAAELTREANKERAAEKAKGSAGARARFKNMFGFGSDAAERAAKNYTRMAEGAGRQERALASKPKSKPLLLVGEEARKANKGTIGGYKKGGKIDGIAIRGKTRAMRKGK